MDSTEIDFLMKSAIFLMNAAQFWKFMTLVCTQQNSDNNSSDFIVQNKICAVFHNVFWHKAGIFVCAELCGKVCITDVRCLLLVRTVKRLLCHFYDCFILVVKYLRILLLSQKTGFRINKNIHTSHHKQIVLIHYWCGWNLDQSETRNLNFQVQGHSWIDNQIQTDSVLKKFFFIVTFLWF